MPMMPKTQRLTDAAATASQSNTLPTVGMEPAYGAMIPAIPLISR